MSTQSTASPDLFLLENCEDFQDFSLQLLAQVRRHVAILSNDLDENLFDNEKFVEVISHIARSSRNVEIQILIKDTKLIREGGHKLVKLTQRLSSKMAIRKLIVEPDDKKMGFMLCDNYGLLYKNDDAIYQGFANFNAAVEVKNLRETFNYLWQYGETEPDIQRLHI